MNARCMAIRPLQGARSGPAGVGKHTDGIECGGTDA